MESLRIVLHNVAVAEACFLELQFAEDKVVDAELHREIAAGIRIADAIDCSS